MVGRAEFLTFLLFILDYFPKRHCVPTRTFLGLPDRSPFQSVSESFRSFNDRFRSFKTFLRRSTGIRIINISGKKRT